MLHALNAELVGEQQPGAGLAGHDADARSGVRGNPHEPQRLRGVDELRHVVDDHGARLSERGAGHAPAAGESAGVRAREGIDVGAPGLERDDGHVGRELLDRLDEAPSVVDALDRECDDLHLLVVREVAEDVGESDVCGVPEPDAEADAKPLAGREEGERMVDPAALGDDREAACRKIRCRADERRAQPGCRVEEARRVRAQDPETGVATDREKARLKLDTLGAGLGPAARVDDRASDPGFCALGEHARHCRGGNGDQRQVDLLGDVGDPGDSRPAGDVVAARVHGVDLSRKRSQAAHQGVAGLPRRRRGPDHGDGARCEEPAERPGGCVARAARDRAQPEPRAARATSSGSTLEGRSSSKRSVVRIQSLPPPRPTSRSTSASGRRSASIASSRT